MSIERTRPGPHEALSVVHRMAYEPGLEIVMGHLLIPLSSGLFEFRIIAANRGPTGVRETVLLGEAAAKADIKTDEALTQLMAGSKPDDPRHDSRFPDHPLSVVRSMLRMLAEPGSIEVTQPALQHPASEVLLPDMGCAMTPPPRYLRTPDSDGTFLRFSRVAFAGGAAGSDGVQMLTLSCFKEDGAAEGPERLKLLTAEGEFLIQGRLRGATSSQLETWSAPGQDGGVHLFFHTVFQPETFGDPQQRTILRLFTQAQGMVNVVMLDAAACLSKEEMLADLEAVIQSWRPLGTTAALPSVSPPPAEKKQKSWWRWWA
ncbi:hypothetical protein [Corallococcus sicarius]|uniref:hypothetical protein n=1 Tax=Corallococcus sicarius TaxID=2316726 RepID=UPI0011C381F6|nr:hypothetical protein [Corallococcus sicarius]